MSKSCKFCNKGGLTWNYNGPIKKWELLEADGSKHRCLILKKSKESAPKTNIKNDPKINAALKVFEKQLKHLEKEKGTNRRNYIMRPARNYEKGQFDD